MVDRILRDIYEQARQSGRSKLKGKRLEEEYQRLKHEAQERITRTGADWWGLCPDVSRTIHDLLEGFDAAR